MSDEVFCANCGKHLCAGTPCSMQLHAVRCVGAAANQEPRSADSDNRRKRLKRVLRCFFLKFTSIIPRGHHFNVSCRGCEFLPEHPPPHHQPRPRHPHIPLLPHPCLEANPLISCVSMDLQRTILYVYEKEGRRRKPIHFFPVPRLSNHFEMAAVLLCFVS